jgi:hypothetical protein
MKEEKQTPRFAFIRREKEKEIITKIMSKGIFTDGCKEIPNIFSRHRITV